MGGTTNSQAIRYPYDGEVLSDLHSKNTADDIATALTTQDTARTKALKRSVVSLSRNALLSCADGVDTLIPWDAENDDPDNLWVIGTPTRIVVPAGLTGIWYVNVQVFSPGFTSSVTKGQLSILVTGTAVKRRTYFSGTSAVKDDLQVSARVNVPNANDYIEASLLHTGGGALNATAIRIKAHRSTQ